MKRILFSLWLSYAVVNGRTFNFVNYCPQTVWMGIVSGSGSPSLQPSDNNYELSPYNGKTSIEIPTSGWSGVIGARTNCSSTGCETGDCGGGTGGCIHGLMQPATQAEFTVSSTMIDFYDVEVINGVNVPISITPSIVSNGTDPYYCGSPGALTPSPGLGACSWKLNPPSVEYRWVTNGGVSCENDNDCGDGLLCGLSFNPGYQQLLQKTCGSLLGYWSADQICGVQRDYGAPFYCSGTPPNQAGITWWNLMACVDVGSCYQPGAIADCCGCVNWDEEGLPVPTNPFTKQCVSRNPNWVDKILPTLRWLKEACPSAYTYPYDDMSSTYTCSDMVNGVNQVSYTIAFCPDNKSK